MCILAQLFFSTPTIQGVKCDGHEQTLGELDKCSADEIMSQFTPFEVGPGLEGLSICGDHIEVLTTHNVRKRHKQCDIDKCVNKASRRVKLEQSRRIFTKVGSIFLSIVEYVGHTSRNARATRRSWRSCPCQESCLCQVSCMCQVSFPMTMKQSRRWLG